MVELGRFFMRTGINMRAFGCCILAAAFHFVIVDATTCVEGVTTVIHDDQAWVAATQGEHGSEHRHTDTHHSPRHLFAADGPGTPGALVARLAAPARFTHTTPRLTPFVRQRLPTDRTWTPGLNTSLEVSRLGFRVSMELLYLETSTTTGGSAGGNRRMLEGNVATLSVP